MKFKRDKLTVPRRCKARGSLRVELDALGQHEADIPHNLPIVVFSDCPCDEPGTRAAKLLMDHGWKDVHTLVGGFDAYLDVGLPVEPVSRSIPATRIMLL